MIAELIVKWLTGKLLDKALAKIKDAVKKPLIIKAFEKACLSVINEEKDLFNDCTLQALICSPETAETETGEDLADQLNADFDGGEFPSQPRLVEILTDSWQRRKQHLDPSEAVVFFRLSDDEVRPVIEKIAKHFFNELAQIPEYRNSFIVKRLQDLSTSDTAPSSDTTVAAIRQSFTVASRSLINWPTTLGNARWIDRLELQTLIERIDSNERSTTLLLGTPGSGKTALLAVLGRRLQEKGYDLLAIKADKLPSTIQNAEDLKTHLELPLHVDKCLLKVAETGKTILLIDQMDALSEIVDLKSERLNILLDLIQNVSSFPGLHIVSSSRWFEFKHDTRLNTIQAEQLELMPISWADVEVVLNETGIKAASLTQEARQLLAVPLHLKLFLDILSRNPSLDFSFTLQGLLEAIWQEKVLKMDGISGKSELIQILSQRMIDDEDYWVPRALADDYKDSLVALEREEILVPDEVGLRVGFRHQTYFDFSKARHFAQGGEKLTEHVLARQDGLFIRPILLSSLDYLRGADPSNYHKELLAIWNHPDLRTHLRSLLTEYLAALESPDIIEIKCLLPLLADDTKMNRALFAMAGSTGWFRTIKDAQLADIMSRQPETAQGCAPILIQALSFARSDVLGLMENCWLTNACYDKLTLSVLQYLKEWDEHAVDIVCLVAARTNDWSISHIGEIVSQTKPELASKIVRADLDRKLLDAEKEDAKQPVLHPPSANASQEERDVYSMSNDPLKNQNQLLETDLGWYELSTIAESAPKSFLINVWPWFIKVLTIITKEGHPFVLEYHDDHNLGTILDRSYSREHQPVTALKDAIELLAENDPVSFLDFFRINENSEYLAVHRLLCRGLHKLVPQYPIIILEYLIADPRRLVIGDFNDCHKESRSLIAGVSPYLKKTELERLERAVLNWNRYHSVDETWTADDRLKRLKWNRQHRLRLLRAFPEDCLSEKTKRLRMEEERAFPMLRDWDSQFSGVHTVGGAMTKDDMEKAKDDEIVNLFDELNDNTGWDHPRHQWKMDRHVGGVIQTSRELGSFAETQPERAVALLSRFKSGLQETPAGAIIEGLAKGSYPSEKIFLAVRELDARGFSSNTFRTAVVQALGNRANKDKGLPDDMLNMMENWLPAHSEPTSDRLQDEKESDDFDTILWGHDSIFMFPGGRDLIFDALAKGYLLREPCDVVGWAKVVERALGYEKHPDVWDIVLTHMPILFNGNRITAVYLYDQVLDLLQSRKTFFDVRSIARILHLVDDTKFVEKWLVSIRDGAWIKGPQAFGELLMYYLCCKPRDPWANSQLLIYLDNPNVISIKRGLAFSAAHNWHVKQCQSICTEVLVALSNCDDEKMATAISRVFHCGERVSLNNDMRKIIQALIQNDRIIMKSAEHLIEGIEYAVSSEPGLVYQICSRFIDVGTEEVKNRATRFASLAEPIVSIALTLHRMPPYRDAGLSLFERLIESNIQEARYALDMLDRRPISTHAQTQLPRRRRRRRVK
jgi:hypothetical protein